MLKASSPPLIPWILSSQTFGSLNDSEYATAKVILGGYPPLSFLARLLCLQLKRGMSTALFII